MCDDNRPEKAKFKLGQKVYTMIHGYLEVDTIKAIFVDKWGAVCVSFDKSDFDDGKYNFGNSQVISQDDVFPSKKALLKNIENQEE